LFICLRQLIEKGLPNQCLGRKGAYNKTLCQINVYKEEYRLTGVEGKRYRCIGFFKAGVPVTS
jgi:hypothetical protein